MWDLVQRGGLSGHSSLGIIALIGMKQPHTLHTGFRYLGQALHIASLASHMLIHSLFDFSQLVLFICYGLHDLLVFGIALRTANVVRE